MGCNVLLRLAGTLLVIALIVAGVVFFKHTQTEALSKAKASGPPPATVTATRVELAQWAQRIEAVGDITAVQDVAIASEVQARVEEIKFSSGEPVKSGDVLVRLDSDEDRAQLRALKAELNLAKLENKRVTSMRGSAALSQSDLDRAKTELDNLEAQVERQQAVLERKELRAPFDGVLGIRQVSQGTIVAPGDPIVRLQSVSPIYADFTVAERHRSELKVGQALEVSVAAWPNREFSGELIVISPDVDVRSRTLKLRAQLENTDGDLQPGMFASIHLFLSGQQPVLTLPRTAISFFAYGESVFVIDADGDDLVVRRQPIKVGRTRGEEEEILSGLKSNEQVVHTGHNKLRDGQKVVISEGIRLPQGESDQ